MCHAAIARWHWRRTSSGDSRKRRDAVRACGKPHPARAAVALSGGRLIPGSPHRLPHAWDSSTSTASSASPPIPTAQTAPSSRTSGNHRDKSVLQRHFSHAGASQVNLVQYRAVKSQLHKSRLCERVATAKLVGRYYPSSPLGGEDRPIRWKNVPTTSVLMGLTAVFSVPWEVSCPMLMNGATSRQSV